MERGISTGLPQSPQGVRLYFPRELALDRELRASVFMSFFLVLCCCASLGPALTSHVRPLQLNLHRLHSRARELR